MKKIISELIQNESKRNLITGCLILSVVVSVLAGFSLSHKSTHTITPSTTHEKNISSTEENVLGVATTSAVQTTPSQSPTSSPQTTIQTKKNSSSSFVSSHANPVNTKLDLDSRLSELDGINLDGTESDLEQNDIDASQF